MYSSTLWTRFHTSWICVYSPQVTHGYPADGPGEANLAIASNAVGEKFKCVAMTLEQPFKDTADDPQHEQGWSPERSMVFGASVLNAIADVEADLWTRITIELC